MYGLWPNCVTDTTKRGTTEMRALRYSGEPRQDNTKYQGGSEYAVSMKAYMDQLSEMNTNSAELTRLKRNLLMALEEDVTPRQREVLMLYYSQQKTMQEIGEILGVNKSTVCRTLKRAEKRLYRLLRYGAGSLLAPKEEE
jgi:RNA polymerase sigma factor (sigma-70 family)